MLLTIPNAALDSLCPTTDQFESTQVEVSLNGRMNKHSIIIMTNEAFVDSVVCVPTTFAKRRSIISNNAWNNLSPTWSGKQLSAQDSRQEDELAHRRMAKSHRQDSPDRRTLRTHGSSERGRSRRLNHDDGGALTRRAASVRPPVVRTSNAAKKALDAETTISPLTARKKIAGRNSSRNKGGRLALVTSNVDWDFSGRKSFKPNLVQKSFLAAVLSHATASRKVAPVMI
ncbi:hypothetical protein MPSEU_000934600 [Mayamaea pseudoterrestris]|nr:hypothetical protein MPSEU_000934600 [Mayamaea pseudoterrestris]